MKLKAHEAAAYLPKEAAHVLVTGPVLVSLSTIKAHDLRITGRGSARRRRCLRDRARSRLQNRSAAMTKRPHYTHPSHQASDAQTVANTRKTVEESLKLLRESDIDTFLGRETHPPRVKKPED
jgi:hypothetical protein